MNMNFKTLAAFCAMTVAITGSLSGCKDDPALASGGDGSNGSNSSNSDTLISSVNVKDVMGYNAVVEVPAPSSTDCTINFSQNAVDVTGGAVDVNGTAVTITRPGVYNVSGSCSDGRIIVDAAKGNEVTLILNGVDLKSASNSVIECRSGKLLTLYLAEGSENKLSDSANYTLGDGETEPDGAVYSKSDMVIAGSGKLTVNGLYKDGVKCKDTLSIDCGSLAVTAKDDGIVGKDFVVIQNGDFAINAGGDGIKSTNSEDSSLGYITINGGKFDIASEADGIQAETALSVKGGTFNIVCGGEAADAKITASSGGMFDHDRNFGWGGSSSSSGSSEPSRKGLKSGADIVIAGGDINIKSADDSIHSNGGVAIYNGTLTLSSCDDGIHADETLTLSGGKIDVTKSYEGLEGKNIEISGGTISVVAEDDGINAAGGDNGGQFGFNSANNDYYISISGGDITVTSNGDGIDSNGTIAQSGGKLTVYGPEGSGNGAIDYDKSYAISGGTLIALGSSGMAQAPGTLSQPCLSIYADAAANSAIEVRDESGKVILSTTTPKRCQSLIFCCEEFKAGSKYGIYANGTLLSEVTATDGIAGGGANSSGMGGNFGQGGGFGHGGGFVQGGGKFDPNNSGFDPGDKSRPDGGFDPNNSDFPGVFGHGGKFDPNNSDFDPNNSNGNGGFVPGGERPGGNFRPGDRFDQSGSTSV